MLFFFFALAELQKHVQSFCYILMLEERQYKSLALEELLLHLLIN